MLRSRFAQCLLAFSCSWLPTIGAAAEPTIRQVAGLSLRVDAELEIESIANPYLIKWPIVADWDGQGRLVVGGMRWSGQAYSRT